MKKIGEPLTVRGRLDPAAEANDNFRISLFDGRFDTAYKVTRFEITPHSIGDPNGDVFVAKLCTESLATQNWFWEDNREIAWSIGSYHLGGNLPFGFQSWIDPENLIVEDLFIVANSGFEGSVNYIIEMQKYNITEWKGALAMVRNKSQGAD